MQLVLREGVGRRCKLERSTPTSRLFMVGWSLKGGVALPVIYAAHAGRSPLQTCFEVAARLMRPGKKPADVPAALAKVAEAYGCRWAGRPLGLLLHTELGLGASADKGDWSRGAVKGMLSATHSRSVPACLAGPLTISYRCHCPGLRCAAPAACWRAC